MFPENRTQLPIVRKLRVLLVEGREMIAIQGARHVGTAHSESAERNKTILHLRGEKNLESNQGSRWVLEGSLGT